MKAYVIHGNTRIKSNTEALAKLLIDELTSKGAEVTQVSLREKNVQTCVGCYKCHKVPDSFGCVINDDMHEIAKEILSSDVIVLSSPIYSWMPTPPMKAVIDRIYAFTKYPDGAEDFNILTKQRFAMVSTSGYEPEENCDLFDEAVRRVARFANLPYIGYLAARDLEDGNMARPEVLDDVRAFAELCLKQE